MAREITSQPTSADEYILQTSPISSSSSYVYPVRSLLSGRIQPAADRQAQPALSRAPSVSNSDTFSKSTILNPNQPIGEGGASKLLDVSFDWGKDVSENGTQETGGSRAELVSPPQTRAKKGMHIVLSKPYGGSNNRFDVDGH